VAQQRVGVAGQVHPGWLNQEEIGDESSELRKKSPVAGISIKMTPAKEEKTRCAANRENHNQSCQPQTQIGLRRSKVQ